MKDFLDELIDERKANDPEFAAQWPAAELRIQLAMLRKKAGLTQSELAKKMNIAQPRIAEVERNPEKVAFGRILAYVQATGGQFSISPREGRAKGKGR
jgi:DNA-binding XRE family transcriptional regulator